MSAIARLSELQTWLNKTLNQVDQIVPLAGDASFRRYFRVLTPKGSYVAMDAPPEQECCRSYVDIARAWRARAICTPEIYAASDQGFLLLSDFGDTLYLDVLQPETADTYYQAAFDVALKIQQCDPTTQTGLPHYSEALLHDEMQLCVTWYLERWLGLTLDQAAHRQFRTMCDRLVDNALAQPVVMVHRDFHSRNLMVLPDQRVGVLDFQDALWGPVTYDAVSLLKDCYIDWPREQVTDWLFRFQRQQLEQGILTEENPQVYQRWFDWMGLQRHLKCLGIFARLNIRDGKPAYCQYLPRLRQYVHSVCQQYPELAPLELFIQAESQRA